MPAPIARMTVAAPVTDIKLLLLILEIMGENVGDRRVAVPFEVSHIRIVGQNRIDYVEHMVLHFRPVQVEHELIAEVICIAVRQRIGPVGVLLEELALGVYHLRLDPDSEFHPCIFSRFRESGDTAG